MMKAILKSLMIAIGGFTIALAVAACSGGGGESQGPANTVKEYYSLWNQKTEVDKMLALYVPQLRGEGDNYKKLKSRLFLTVQQLEVTSVTTGKAVFDGETIAYVPVKRKMRQGGHISQTAPEDQIEESVFKLTASGGKWLISDLDYQGPLPKK
jgi:hypothetical protein